MHKAKAKAKAFNIKDKAKTWKMLAFRHLMAKLKPCFRALHTTPLKKSNATRLLSIISHLSWICTRQIRYPWKACLFALRLMPYLFGLFHWGVCRMRKLGAMVKMKSCKIDRILWEMRATCMSCSVLSFCERMHSYPLRPGPIIVPKSSETQHNAEFQIVMQFSYIYCLTLRLI